MKRMIQALETQMEIVGRCCRAETLTNNELVFSFPLLVLTGWAVERRRTTAMARKRKTSERERQFDILLHWFVDVTPLK